MFRQRHKTKPPFHQVLNGWVIYILDRWLFKMACVLNPPPPLKNLACSSFCLSRFVFCVRHWSWWVYVMVSITTANTYILCGCGRVSTLNCWGFQCLAWVCNVWWCQACGCWSGQGSVTVSLSLYNHLFHTDFVKSFFLWVVGLEGWGGGGGDQSEDPAKKIQWNILNLCVEVHCVCVRAHVRALVHS